jgi:uncharacterized protein (DUF1697 family)
MQTYIAILRGINVSGHKLIKMDALKASFEHLGFADVHTYIQSGNVIFKSAEGNSNLLAAKIKTMLADEYGFDVPVQVKTAAEMEGVLNNNPFIKNVIQDLNALHVTFLAEKPLPEHIAKLNKDFGADVYIITDKIIYLYCPNGYGKTKLTNTFFESKLKVSATTRNWKTISTLVHLAQ